MYRDSFDLHTTFDLPGEGSRDRYIRMKPGDHMTLQSLYGQIDYQLTEDLLLNAGVRVEQGSDYSIIYGYQSQPQNAFLT